MCQVWGCVCAHRGPRECQHVWLRSPCFSRRVGAYVAPGPPGPLPLRPSSAPFFPQGPRQGWPSARPLPSGSAGECLVHYWRGMRGMLRPGGDMVLGDCGEGGTGAAPWCCLLHQAPGAGSGQPLGSREAAAGAARPLQGLALNAGLLCTPVTWPSLAILGLQASGPLHLPASPAEGHGGLLWSSRRVGARPPGLPPVQGGLGLGKLGVCCWVETWSLGSGYSSGQGPGPCARGSTWSGV